MCLKRDRLILSECYFNAQLAARWENASRCVEQDPFQQPSGKFIDRSQLDARTKNSIRLLARWSYPAEASDVIPTFDAMFDKPKMVCIRENMALLTLEIKRGTLYLDG